MLRAKDALVALPSNAGEDFAYNDEDDDDFEDAEGSLEGEDEGPSSSVSLPAWLFFQHADTSVIHSEIQSQATTILSSGNETSSTSITATLVSQDLDNLKLHKIQPLLFKQEIDHLNSTIVYVKDGVKNQIEAKLPNK